MTRSHTGTLGVAVLMLGTLVAPQPVGAASTAPVAVALAPKSTSYGTPYGFMTNKGTTLVSWYVDPGGQIKKFLLARQRGSGKFTAINVVEKVSGKPMLISAAPQFYQSGKTIRMVTQAQVPALGQEHQGAYVWTSTNDGKSWSAPKLVYKYFGSNEIGQDSAGGFWAVSNIVGVEVIHVPSSLARQANSIKLSDRISSRWWIKLATAGPKRTLLTAFYSSSASYLHVGSAVGKQHDVRLFGKSATPADLAGDAKRAMVVALHPRSNKANAPYAVYARAIAVNSSGKVTLGQEVRLSAKSEEIHQTDVSVQAIAGRAGQFTVTWLNAKDQLRNRRTTATGWAAATTRYSYGASHAYSFLSAPTATAKWIVSAGFHNRKSGQVSAILAVSAA